MIHVLMATMLAILIGTSVATRSPFLISVSIVLTIIVCAYPTIRRK